MALKRMDNVGIVVESLDAAISFFAELGLELEGRAMLEGEWAGRVTGLGDQRVEIAMMRTPDGHSRLELSRFLTPPVVADHRNAPVNALGYLRVMFAVDDIDETLARLRRHGAELVSSEVVQYQDVYRGWTSRPFCAVIWLYNRALHFDHRHYRDTGRAFLSFGRVTVKVDPCPA